MRKILFRGQSRHTMEWRKGDLIHFEGDTFIHLEGTDFIKDTYFTGDVFPETVGQFVGFTDKKGQEIYEGMKIVRCIGFPEKESECETWVVYFGRWCWKRKREGEIDDHGLPFDAIDARSNCEIIED